MDSDPANSVSRREHGWRRRTSACAGDGFGGGDGLTSGAPGTCFVNRFGKASEEVRPSGKRQLLRVGRPAVRSCNCGALGTARPTKLEELGKNLCLVSTPNGPLVLKGKQVRGGRSINFTAARTPNSGNSACHRFVTFSVVTRRNSECHH